MKNKIWVGTNWKMTKTIREGLSYTEELISIAENISSNIELFIIPSYTALVPIKKLTSNSRVHIGSQNMHWEDQGAFTGEISPKMLDEIGVNIIELGHSERRQYYNENDEDINKKVHSGLKYGMKPLVCIGENIEQKANGISKEMLAAQLKVCLKDLTEEQAQQVMIAYEPVWAIGESGIPADATYVSEIHQFLREQLMNLFGDAGSAVPLLYGGSVNFDNFIEYIDIEDVNGLFIGRSAWNTESFEKILHRLDEHLFA
ncbi:triose-phosphate isomerase [Oceanobacillus sp. Castelsardo]|uniref:triose-phosphate isomerase n=1 Tax=Oceanobacillus sp. Castelsardo TaxID=1851204 RepID=UPI000AC324BF|nr:triose-phosphate isomerase [Oceanobacillus sp. Castelsardo]